MVKSSVNGPFAIAMLNNQRVTCSVDTHVRTGWGDLVSLEHWKILSYPVESETQTSQRQARSVASVACGTSRNSSGPSLPSRLGMPSRPAPVGRLCCTERPPLWCIKGVLTCWKRTGAKGLSLSYGKDQEMSLGNCGFLANLCCLYALNLKSNLWASSNMEQQLQLQAIGT